MTEKSSFHLRPIKQKKKNKRGKIQFCDNDVGFYDDAEEDVIYINQYSCSNYEGTISLILNIRFSNVVFV